MMGLSCILRFAFNGARTTVRYLPFTLLVAMLTTPVRGPLRQHSWWFYSIYDNSWRTGSVQARLLDHPFKKIVTQRLVVTVLCFWYIRPQSHTSYETHCTIPNKAGTQGGCKHDVKYVQADVKSWSSSFLKKQQNCMTRGVTAFTERKICNAIWCPVCPLT
jgi:hypothetical protein